jgi:hypothetical protein
VKLGIKEKGEEEGCMERNIYTYRQYVVKIMTIYSKEMKTTIRGVEDTIKENREECKILGGDFNGRIGERGARNWGERRGRWEKKIQRHGGKCRSEETDGID